MTWKSIKPVISFNSPSKIWNDTPANLILEVQFFILFFLSARNAFIKERNRMYRIAWIMSLFCGVMIELLTILPESIGNFYHSQFVIMFFDHREPLYMLPCIYVWFLYTFTTTIWSMNWSTKLSEYAFTIIIIFFIWQPFDLIGIHFQFWTWHNNEPLYFERNGGVPIASTFWMMSFIGGMQLSLRCIRDWYFLANRKNWSRDVSFIQCIGLAVIASIVNISIFMMIPFGLIFHPISNKQFGLGYSCNAALYIFLYLCIGIVLFQFFNNMRYIAIRCNEYAFLNIFCLQILIGYIGVLLLMIHFIDIKSGNIKQVTYHQMLAMDGIQVKESSFFGIFERNKYIVNHGIDKKRDHYSLDCYDFNKEYDETDFVEWYGLCLTGLESEWISYFDKLLIVSGVLLFVSQFVVFTHISQSFNTSKKKKKT